MDYRDPKNSIGQVERLARYYHHQFKRSIGSSLSVEDLTQEFWIVWQRVVEVYDPARGAAFSTVLWKSLRNAALRIAEYHGRRSKIGCVSLDQQNVGSDHGMIETISSDEDSALDQIIQRERTERILAKIDPRLRLIVELLQKPSELMEREIEGLRAKAEYGQSIGATTLPQPRITISMLMELFGLDRKSQYRFLDQMKEVMENE